MALLIVVGVLAVVALLGWRFGADSRSTRDWEWGAPDVVSHCRSGRIGRA